MELIWQSSGNRTYRIAVLGLAVVMILLLAVPAYADVSKTGYKYCSTGQTPYANGYASGDGEVFPPGSGYATFSHGSTLKWTGKKYAPSGLGGWWGVYSDDLISNQTYAACAPFS
ncbi:MAG: hypothetical protein ABFR95_04235 [Actinomycetota bacterium]